MNEDYLFIREVINKKIEELKHDINVHLDYLFEIKKYSNLSKTERYHFEELAEEYTKLNKLQYALDILLDIKEEM